MQKCGHGFIAVTCGICRGAAAPAPQPDRVDPYQEVHLQAQGGRTSHYSGAPRETREYLTSNFFDILNRATERIERDVQRNGDGAEGLISPSRAKFLMDQGVVMQ